MNRINKLHLIVLFFMATVLCACCFPEFLVTHTMSFNNLSDYFIEYYTTFGMTSFIYQGGIQLWNSFGQMPFAFIYVTHGFFKLPQILTAVSYFLLSPLSTHPAEFFHALFSVVFVTCLLWVRVAGNYLLLNQVCSDRRILGAATVLGAVLYSGLAFIMGVPHYSFYPLLMFFVLKFFSTLKGRDLAALFLLYCVLLSQGVIYLAYIHLGMNLFIFSCFVWSLTARREQWRNLLKNASQCVHGHARKALGVAFLAGLMLLPYVYIKIFCLNDYAFDAQNSRIAHMWSLSHYFRDLPLTLASPHHFFAPMMDLFFDDTMPFFGYTMFFFAVVALVFARDSRKWIFAGSILLVWLVNFPRDQFSIGLLGHLVNALTNPLKSLVRGYDMASITAIPFFFLPLAVMGIEVILTQPWVHDRKRWAWVGACMIGLIGIHFGFWKTPTRMYVMCFWAASTFAGFMVFARSTVSRSLKSAVIIIFVLIDASIVLIQTRDYFLRDGAHRPYLISSDPQEGAVGLDYQNPKIFPFRDYSTFQFSYPEEGFLWVPHNLTGIYYRISNQETMCLPVEPHSPRHRSFAGWSQNPAIMEYVKTNDRTFFFSPSLDNSALHADPAPVLSWDYFTVPLVDGWLPDVDPKLSFKDQMGIYSFKLPPAFPLYRATTIFGKGQGMLRFFMTDEHNQSVEFQAAQGDLIKPYTFDINNIREGYVFAAFPLDKIKAGLKCTVLYPNERKEGVVRILKNSDDVVDLIFKAPRQGWAVTQYPYDLKWQVKVDGRIVKYGKTEYNFLSIPVPAGDHRITLSYWPDSPLRALLWIASVVSLIVFFWLIYSFLAEKP